MPVVTLLKSQTAKETLKRGIGALGGGIALFTASMFSSHNAGEGSSLSEYQRLEYLESQGKLSDQEKWDLHQYRVDFFQMKSNFLPNPHMSNTFQVVTNLHMPVGSKGQTSIRTIVGYDGRVINAFPVNQ